MVDVKKQLLTINKKSVDIYSQGGIIAKLSHESAGQNLRQHRTLKSKQRTKTNM